MLNFLKNNNLKFKKIADDFQLILNDASDLKQVINIDPTLWAVTSLPIDAVVFNYDFLKYIDTDNNKKIHPIQFITALKWLFNMLIKYDGITTQSEQLNLANLNKEQSQTKLIQYTVKTINKQLKKKPKNIIALETILNYNIENIDDEDFLAGYILVKKLLLFQRYMIQFANNYVTLDSLYNPHTLSIMQPGYLIMSGNYYTLAVKVTNINQHKQIIRKSNICTIYVEITSKTEKLILAFAITYNVIQNLYIGKTGIYIDRRDGSQWDAKVIDIIQQPISIMQAIIYPFIKIHQIILNQIQNKLKKQEDDFQNERLPICKPQSPNKFEPKNLAINSIGIAALGSAGAFIVSSLHSISFLSILTFIFGIICLIFIPIILIASIKLYNRSITEFYTASGWSINPKVRLKHKMGNIFTYSPKHSIKMNIVKDDLIKKFTKQFESPHYIRNTIIINIIIGIILSLTIYFCNLYFHIF